MADRRPVLFRNGTVLTMDDAHTVVQGGDVLVVDDKIAEVGTGLTAPDGAAGGRRDRRHRDAGDDRHPPSHVADGDAGVRRRLDAHPVLRLVLPRARPAVPARGHPRRQRGLGLGRSRVRRHHHRRLVPRPADRRPRRRRGRRPPGGPGTVRARLRQHPGRALGVDRRPRGQGVLRPAPHRRRHARASRSPSTCSARSPSPRARRSRSPASSACRTPRTPASGARPTTTASG